MIHPLLRVRVHQQGGLREIPTDLVEHRRVLNTPTQAFNIHSTTRDFSVTRRSSIQVKLSEHECNCCWSCHSPRSTFLGPRNVHHHLSAGVKSLYVPNSARSLAWKVRTSRSTTQLRAGSVRGDQAGGKTSHELGQSTLHLHSTGLMVEKLPRLLTIRGGELLLGLSNL